MERSDWKIDMSRQFIRSSFAIEGETHTQRGRRSMDADYWPGSHFYFLVTVKVLLFSLALQNPLVQQKTRPLLQYFCDCGKDKGTLFPLKQSRKVFSNSKERREILKCINKKKRKKEEEK